MKTPGDAIKDIAAEVQDTPAITGTKPDKNAYSKATVRYLWGAYMHKEGKTAIRDQVKTALKTDSLAALDLLSKRNLKEILRDTQEALAAKENAHGQDVVNAVIESARQACKFSNLSLTHSTSWSGSSYVSDGALEEILEERMLKAPGKLDPDNEHTLIYCGFAGADEKVSIIDDSDTFFRMNNVPEKDFRRSLTVVKTEYPIRDGRPMHEDEDRSVFVGGNHLQAAWTLATINNTLRALEEMQPGDVSAQHAAKIAQGRSLGALVEMMVPNQMNLQGHIFVNNGVEETIEREVRAARKPKPEKKDIAPANDNEHLKRQPRRRGKTDDE